MTAAAAVPAAPRRSLGQRAPDLLVWGGVILLLMLAFGLGTWPVLLAIQARLWGKRGLAVAVMTIVLLLFLVVPFWLVDCPTLM